MENSLRNTELYKKWKSYGIEDEYCVFVGSAALLMKGIRQRIHDLDIWILDEKVWKEFLAEHTLEKSSTTNAQVVVLEEGKIEVGNTFLKEYFGDQINWRDCVELFDGLWVLRLDFVKRYKEILNRDKDRRDLRLIEEYEKNLR